MKKKLKLPNKIVVASFNAGKISEIKRYIEQQNEVILYYEKAVREEPKIVEEDLDG